ncbi:MAG TPA: hypothetical protein VNS59_07760 [Lysobacter sp.]|nr:hypothetical protein [Lysobacter sp.]
MKSSKVRLRASRVLLLSLATLCTLPAVAQESKSTRDSGDAAHLFGYLPKDGMRAQFDAGYRKHLEWHAMRADPLVWYGWYVTHGPRAGMFIDGSFGAPFAAFDQRVAPADDAKDAERSFLGFAEPTFRMEYRVRRDLSTGTPLERWQPTPLVEVHRYRVKLGRSSHFELLAKRMRSTLEASGAKDVAYTWYQGVAGTGTPEYMLMVSRNGWAGFDGASGDLEGVLGTLGDATTRRELLMGVAASVDEVTSEVWQYRSDLSLVPKTTLPAQGGK